MGAERAGRLVDPDEGYGEDTEKDLVGTDVGIDGAAASAEEAAVHVIPDDGERGLSDRTQSDPETPGQGEGRPATTRVREEKLMIIFVILALVLAVFGVVRLVQGDILWGIVLIIAACAVGPGGWFIFD